MYMYMWLLITIGQSIHVALHHHYIITTSLLSSHQHYEREEVGEWDADAEEEQRSSNDGSGGELPARGTVEAAAAQVQRRKWLT